MNDEKKMIYQIIAKNIKYYREMKGWTVADLVREIGYNEEFIVKLELAYYTKKCTLEVVYRIGIALEMNPGLLMVDLSQEKNKTEISNS